MPKQAEWRTRGNVLQSDAWLEHRTELLKYKTQRRSLLPKGKQPSNQGPTRSRRSILSESQAKSPAMAASSANLVNMSPRPALRNWARIEKWYVILLSAQKKFISMCVRMWPRAMWALPSAKGPWAGLVWGSHNWRPSKVCLSHYACILHAQEVQWFGSKMVFKC